MSAWIDVLEHDRGEPRLVRYFAAAVRRELDRAVADHVLGGAAAALPRRALAELEGYRVRARLGAIAGVVDVVGGGVRRIKRGGLPPLAAAFGHPFVALRLVPGSPLPEARDALAVDRRARALRSIVAIVRALHDRGVAHGALGPGSFFAAEVELTLVDLGPLRDATERAIADDRAAIATIAEWLLGATTPGPAALHAMWHEASVARDDGTIAVPDDATEVVPDD